MHTYSQDFILQQLRTQHNKHLPEHNNYRFIHSSSNSSVYIHKLTFSATYSSGLNLKPIPGNRRFPKLFLPHPARVTPPRIAPLLYKRRLPFAWESKNGKPANPRSWEIHKFLTPKKKNREQGWDCVLICKYKFIYIIYMYNMYRYVNGMWIWIETKEHMCIYIYTLMISTKSQR